MKRAKTLQIAIGVAQVLKYTTGTWKGHIEQKLEVGGPIESGSFIRTIGSGTYLIVYSYAGGGVIGYDYWEVKEKNKISDLAIGISLLALAAILIIASGGTAAPVMLPLLIP